MARPSSPEQKHTLQPECEEQEIENDKTVQSQASGSEEGDGLENIKTLNEIQEISNATSQVEKGVDGDGGTQKDEVENQKDMNKIIDGESECTIPTPPPYSSPVLHSDHDRFISVEEREVSCDSSRLKDRIELPTSSNPDLCHQPIQNSKSPKRGSTFTKRDKRIIEKIRSYYEAAAEAEEEEAEEDDGSGEGVTLRRRNSFSQIPTGLVKESVSRFDMSEQEAGADSGQSRNETTDPHNRETEHEVPSSSSTGRVTCQTSLSGETKDGQADDQISGSEFEAEDKSVPFKTASGIQDGQNANQMGMRPQSQPDRPLEIGRTDSFCEIKSEEELKAKPEGNTIGIVTQSRCRDKKNKSTVLEQASIIGNTPTENHKDSSTPLSECQKTETKVSSTWTRAKLRDMHKTSGNFEGLPSQVKVGRYSHHSRIVTANRALFEGMAADIAGIGFFEANPVVDPSLMVNSERILSKVQTLAQMYSAKASTMKVPLHQKRASGVRNQSLGVARLSGVSTQLLANKQTQADYKCPMESNKLPKYHTQRHTHANAHRSPTHTEPKVQSNNEYEFQTKVQSKTTTQTSDQMQIQQAKQTTSPKQIQKSTKAYSEYQNQTVSQRDQSILEERLEKKSGRFSSF